MTASRQCEGAAAREEVAARAVDPAQHDLRALRLGRLSQAVAARVFPRAAVVQAEPEVRLQAARRRRSQERALHRRARAVAGRRPSSPRCATTSSRVTASVWPDKPEWTLKNGKTVQQPARGPRSRRQPSENDDNHADARRATTTKTKWYKPEPELSRQADSATTTRSSSASWRGRWASSRSTSESRGKSEGVARSAAGARRAAPAVVARSAALAQHDLRAARSHLQVGGPSRSLQGHGVVQARRRLQRQAVEQERRAQHRADRSVENELGGPLSDEDWLTEPASDGA